MPGETALSAATEVPVLRAAVGAYKHTAALRSGQVVSAKLRLQFADVSPVSRAFAPMVREGRFDVCEMAIATFLQAKAYGKPLVLLPVTMAARFQEAALRGPADLHGRRVGVRAYSQTTGMWLRGILAESHGVLPDAVRWVTFEDAHVAEYRDPPWAERAPSDADMLAMLRAGALDAATGELIVSTSPTKTSADFAALLRRLDWRYGPKPGGSRLPVVLVLDNGPIHTSKASRAALDARPWITVEWLPRYAPS